MEVVLYIDIVIKLTCGHELCLECFNSICKKNSKCPLVFLHNGHTWDNTKILFSKGF